MLEFLVDFDEARASNLHGRKKFGQLMTHPETEREFANALVKVEEESQLKAKYVRDFIYQLLEFCPGEYFNPGPDGHWIVGEQEYKQIPQSVRRFITEFRLLPGGMISVRFVSKEKALELAAKFTLIQKAEMQVAQVPWYELATAALSPREDELNKRIAAVAANGNGAHK